MSTRNEESGGAPSPERVAKCLPSLDVVPFESLISALLRIEGREPGQPSVPVSVAALLSKPMRSNGRTAERSWVPRRYGPPPRQRSPCTRASRRTSRARRCVRSGCGHPREAGRRSRVGANAGPGEVMVPPTEPRLLASSDVVAGSAQRDRATIATFTGNAKVRHRRATARNRQCRRVDPRIGETLWFEHSVLHRAGRQLAALVRDGGLARQCAARFSPRVMDPAPCNKKYVL